MTIEERMSVIEHQLDEIKHSLIVLLEASERPQAAQRLREMP